MTGRRLGPGDLGPDPEESHVPVPVPRPPEPSGPSPCGLAVLGTLVCRSAVYPGCCESLITPPTSAACAVSVIAHTLSGAWRESWCELGDPQRG